MRRVCYKRAYPTGIINIDVFGAVIISVLKGKRKNMKSAHFIINRVNMHDFTV